MNRVLVSQDIMQFILQLFESKGIVKSLKTEIK